MTSIYLIDGHHHPPKGVRRGMSGAPASAAKIDREGTETPLPPVSVEVLRPGEFIVGTDSGGGGYGDPLERDPQRVLHDITEKWVTVAQAHNIYGVVFAERDGELQVESAATADRRQALRRTRAASCE
jgi:N-methylhydantoinase B